MPTRTKLIGSTTRQRQQIREFLSVLLLFLVLVSHHVTASNSYNDNVNDNKNDTINHPQNHKMGNKPVDSKGGVATSVSMKRNMVNVQIVEPKGGAKKKTMKPKKMKNSMEQKFRKHHMPSPLLHPKQQQHTAGFAIKYPEEELRYQDDDEHEDEYEEVTRRQLQKNDAGDEGGGKDDKKGSPIVEGRGAAKQAKGLGVKTASDADVPFLYSRGGGEIPVIDWTSWGNVWVEEDSVTDGGGANKQGAGKNDAINDEYGVEDNDDGPGGNGGGEGEGGGGGGGGGEGDAGNGGKSGTGYYGNPYLDEEDWESQFVQALSPPVAIPPQQPQLYPDPVAPAPAPDTTDSGGNTTGNTTADEAVPTPTTPLLIPMTTPLSTGDRGSCQLCSDGQAATQMTRTLIGTTVSCQDIANTLATADVDACPVQKSVLPVDIEAYCGCPGKSYSGSCTFCPSGKENIWHNITITSLNGWTCEDVEVYATYISNSGACAEMTKISDICCGTWEEYWAYGDDDNTA